MQSYPAFFQALASSGAGYLPMPTAVKECAARSHAVRLACYASPSLHIFNTVSREEPYGGNERLRADAPAKPFHVVLVEPEIPPNTGNIARLCAATNTPLHLVGKLGFRIDEQAVRRAGVDYWHLVNVVTHPTLCAAESHIGASSTERVFLLSGRAERSIYDVVLQPGDVFVFGKESSGLGAPLLGARKDNVFGIPTIGGVRSLNLANSVSIVLYEALRQTGALAQTERR